jgi:uncharacterized membrane protein YkvA (DUF1232 family)
LIEKSDRRLDPATQTKLKEYALLLPRLVKLLWRLTRDPRVPARVKATLFLSAAYIAFPPDLIPDFIPGLGQVDDLIVVAFALDQIINRVPEEVVLEHWDGDDDVLQVIQEILDIRVRPGMAQEALLALSFLPYP